MTRTKAAITPLIAILALAFLATFSASAAHASRWAKPPEADIASSRMFGIGAADPDNDGWQDIFTTNHKYRSSFLENVGGERFREVADERGLIPDERFPGIELARGPADMSRPGLYVWPYDTPGDGEPAGIEIVSNGVVAQGRLKLLGYMGIKASERADVALSRDDDDRPIADFTIAAGGNLDLAVSSLSDLPIQWNFDDAVYPISPAEIFVGAYAVNPEGLDFTFTLHDRHAMAFADLAGDSDQDVFVSTGGLGGGIALPRYLGKVNDQLLISGAGPGGGYSDRYASSGLEKGRCRGRVASLTDFDDDGRLDLFASCDGDPPQLYEQTGAGRFYGVPGPLSPTDIYRWGGIDRDRRQELLCSTARGLEVWSYAGGEWRLDQRLHVGADALQIALADFDNSGSLDAMVTVPAGLVVLRNRGGRLHRVSADRLGLPTGRVAAASFVDYDNDGDQDVSTAPGGIYAQGSGGRFHATRQLRLPAERYAILQWIDFDNDGRRDPLVATQKREFARQSKITRRRNLTPGGHWLELDLRGLAGNREAVGAKVRVSYRDRGRARGRGKQGRRAHERRTRTQTQWVGQDDDSRYSQGHYRVYFGLGGARRAGRVAITWANGERKRLHHVKADRLLRIAQR